MSGTRPTGRPERGFLAWCGFAFVGVVFLLAALNWVGWAADIEELTRVVLSWPRMTPWTAALLAGLGVAILLQSGRPSRARVWVGRGLAAAAGVVVVLFLAEYAAGSSFGVDQVWFGESLRRLQSTWPGRPSPHTAVSVLMLSVAVALIRFDRRWSRVAWPLSLAAGVLVPGFAILAYLFDAVSLVKLSTSTGMGFTAACGLIFLAAATVLARPDRNPVAWLLVRPGRRTLIRMAFIVAVLPILVALSRWVFLSLGVHGDAVWVLAIMVGTFIAAAATFYLSQREVMVLAEKEDIGRQNEVAEERYRILADNAVDVIVCLRGNEVVFVSPSAQPAFGWAPDRWIGADFTRHTHPDALGAAFSALKQITGGESAIVRFRIATADGGYRWVDGHGKPYIDSEGNTDGMIFAVRIVDEQVAAQEQLRIQKERFEAVVGNAPSAISVLDHQSRYTWVNEAFCQLFGQESVEGVIGQTEEAVLPPDVLERSQLAADDLWAGAESTEEELIQRGAETISVVTQRFPLPNAAGALMELATIRTDITHRKTIEREAAGRAEWQELIGAAIGDGRLLVYSQPIVDIVTREPIEEELLVRLRSIETEEILPPDEFLPQCERYGLMPMIDRYMVGRAVELARAGRQVTVNITGQTIADETAMSEILEVLTIAGPEATGRMIFEITETTALASPAKSKAFSVGMRGLGCRVALDDFGTGYGTFTELRNLDLHVLKIDQGFVKTVLEDRDDERVVSAIVGVARAFGLTTIAEGVETEAVLKKLADLGADLAQGYLFGRPTPVFS